MYRKRRTPAPGFKEPAPFNPAAGSFAPIGRAGLSSRLTTFQVVAADTHANYVICQGWNLDTDPHCRYLLTNIAVAKPYAIRGTYPYQVGWVLVAAKTRTSLGDNPGVASVTTGQPANLGETVNLLNDANGNPINWIDVSTGSSVFKGFELYNDITPGISSILAWPLTATLTRDSTNNPPVLQVADSLLKNVRAYGSNHGWTTTTSGARGLYMAGPDGKNDIVAIQWLAKLCSATVTVTTSGGNFTVNTVAALDDGQSPVAQASDTLSVADWNNVNPAVSSKVLIAPDGAGGWKWVSPAGGSLLWGKVTGGPYTNVDGATGLSFTVNNCTSDGTLTSGTSTVHTPLLGAYIAPATCSRKWTSIFNGDVVGFVATAGTYAYTCVTDCFDDPIGTVRMLGAAGSIVPNGWTDITANLVNVADGAFPRADTAPSMAFVAGDTHTHTAHSDHAVTTGCYNLSGSGTPVVKTITPSHDNNHSTAVALYPNYFKVRYIQRTS